MIDRKNLSCIEVMCAIVKSMAPHNTIRVHHQVVRKVVAERTALIKPLVCAEDRTTPTTIATEMRGTVIVAHEVNGFN